MTTSRRRSHWEAVYETKGESEVSWHQDEPTCSLELVTAYAPPGGRVVDIGGGSSVLAGRLATLGFAVTVLDISTAALTRAHSRIDQATAAKIDWVAADITTVGHVSPCDVWHDRAVFHFLTDEADRQAYRAVLKHSVRPGGHVVLGTFAMDGPAQCSGLPVERYDAAALMETMGSDLTFVHALQQTHTTPWGAPQSFFWAVLRAV